MKSMLDRLPRHELRRAREILEVEGYCLSCREITPNRSVVVGRLMKSRKCEVCGRVIQPARLALAECYVDELVGRLGVFVQSFKPTHIRSFKGRLQEIPRMAGMKVLQEVAYLGDLFFEDDG